MKVCVFDLDGTVMDTVESIAYFVNYTLEKLGLPVIETEKFKYFAGDGRDVLLERSLEYVDAFTPEIFRRAVEYYDEAYTGNFMYLTKPFDGIEDAVKKIKDSGMQVAVLSNKPDNVTQLVIEKAFGKDLFAHVQGQIETIKKKPDPSGFIAIAQKFAAEPSECVMIGDTNVDMMTGVNAGAHTLGVLWGFRPRKELEDNGAEKIIESVSELPEAVLSF